LRTRDYDEWTIDRWRVEPRLRALELDVDDSADRNPPLWKDLTLASVVAILLWGSAAVLFG
jgi:hypothetical protein